jgi:hypothetical protein
MLLQFVKSFIYFNTPPKVSIYVNNNWIIQITIILKNGHKKK